MNELARRANTSAAQIFNIVNGKKFGTDKMLLIINALPDINPMWLIFGSGNMKSVEVEESGEDLPRKDTKYLLDEDKVKDKVRDKVIEETQSPYDTLDRDKLNPNTNLPMKTHLLQELLQENEIELSSLRRQVYLLKQALAEAEAEKDSGEERSKKAG